VKVRLISGFGLNTADGRGMVCIENKMRTYAMDSTPEKSPFLQQISNRMRLQNYAIRTEQTYLGWIKRFILYHDKRHPAEMGEIEVANYLTHLAVDRNVSPATQGQALNALVYLYAKIFENPLGDITGLIRPKKKQKFPVVLSQAEVARLLSYLEGPQWLVACLLYGSGLRLMEGIRLRVKDIDFDRLAIIVRSGKEAKTAWLRWQKNSLIHCRPIWSRSDRCTKKTWH
jgi:integrase